MAGGAPQDRLDRIRALLADGKPAAAVAAAEAALRERPADPRFWACLGAAQASRGDLTAGMAALAQATTLNPRLPAVWCELGRVCAGAGEVKRAAQCYREALVLAPGHRRARSGLAALPPEVIPAEPEAPRARRAAPPPAAAQPARRRRGWRYLAVACTALTLGFLVFCWRDSQAIPKTVDCVRGVVGDRAVLALEELVYGAKGWLEDRLDDGQTPAAAGAATPAAPPAPPPAAAPAVFRPADLARDAGDPDAGRWVDRGTFYLTHVYPEGKRRSIADLAYIKPGAALHVACGTREPAEGPGIIAPEHLPRAFMAFSGGFQYKHFPGGIVCEGGLLRALRSGVGTLVVRHDNQVRIGVWGREWSELLPQMKDVRQFLLLVDHGQFNENVNFDAYALSRAVRVYRSALGLTKEGHLVYAAGNNLSAAGLAEALLACGVVSAVHLDMNYGNATCGVMARAEGQPQIEPLTERFPDPSRFLGRNYRDFLYLTRAERGARPPA